MNAELSNSAVEILEKAGAELMRLYTGSALALNAYDNTARYYGEKAGGSVSLTGNIPASLRLPFDGFENTISREKLVEHYRTEALKRNSEDYLIRSVSVVDASLEEIYEVALKHTSPDTTERQRQKHVRDSWGRPEADGRTNIEAYLIDTAGLIAPPEKTSTISMVFDRYCEIREIRHALVHNGGVLSARMQARLAQLRDRMPENIRKGSFASKKFLADGVVVMSPSEMLRFRWWFYTVIFGFLPESFRQLAVGQP